MDIILLFTTITISHATNFDFYVCQCPFDVPACFVSPVNIYLSSRQGLRPRSSFTRKISGLNTSAVAGGNELFLFSPFSVVVDGAYALVFI